MNMQNYNISLIFHSFTNQDGIEVCGHMLNSYLNVETIHLLIIHAKSANEIFICVHVVFGEERFGEKVADYKSMSPIYGAAITPTHANSVPN